jgi:SAM-dependent methyltransferase
MVGRRERKATDRFAERYREAPVDVLQAIERTVIGGDWGANGYTTIAQADELAAALDPRRRSLLLDIGAGRGWPGLYLAAVSGCSAVLTDVPFDALTVARTRARRDSLDDRTSCVNASARDLPFRPGTFDAVVHAGVLC